MPTKMPIKSKTLKSNIKSTPFIPTKRQRKLINKAYKAISESLTTDEFISFDSTLYNGEVPFEFTLEYLQSLNSIDLFQDEYINLLYEAFDTYSIFEQFLQEKEDDRIQSLEEKELKRQRDAKKKKKRKLSDYDKYLNRVYYVLYDKERLLTKRMYLLHTLRKILTKETGIDYTIPHYYVHRKKKKKYKPFWYDDWVEKKKTESKQLKKINDIIELEQITKALEKLEQQEKENKLKEQLAQLQSMFNPINPINLTNSIDTTIDTTITITEQEEI